jgi:hypothetical protein
MVEAKVFDLITRRTIFANVSDETTLTQNPNRVKYRIQQPTRSTNERSAISFLVRTRSFSDDCEFVWYVDCWELIKNFLGGK